MARTCGELIHNRGVGLKADRPRHQLTGRALCNAAAMQTQNDICRLILTVPDRALHWMRLSITTPCAAALALDALRGS